MEIVPETRVMRGDETKPRLQVARSLAEGDHVKVTSRAKSADVSELFDESKVTGVEPKQRKRSSAASKRRSKARHSSTASGLSLSYNT